MAIFSKKGGSNKGDDDLPAVVRSANEEAAGIRDSEIAPTRGAGRTPPGSATSDDLRRTGVRGAARAIPADAPAPGAGQDTRDLVLAANDDRESFGEFTRSLQRRPARTPYVIAGLFTTLWLIACAALLYGFSGHLRQMLNEAGVAPTVIGLCGAFGAPIVFFFALASMIARLNELRIVSSSMAEATQRFAAPGDHRP